MPVRGAIAWTSTRIRKYFTLSWVLFLNHLLQEYHHL